MYSPTVLSSFSLIFCSLPHFGSFDRIVAQFAESVNGFSGRTVVSLLRGCSWSNFGSNDSKKSKEVFDIDESL